MLDVKINYKNKHSNLICPNCESAEDDQAHLLTCAKLADEMELVKDGFNYENIFKSNVDEILRVSRRKSKQVSRKENT